MSVALLRLKKTNLQNMPKHDLLQIGQALQNDNRGQQPFSRNFFVKIDFTEKMVMEDVRPPLRSPAE